eukprot:CAMPEP_0204821628 /NCGR_PEP_ID=MMETSP1018-20131115/38560_1 /ASSEMBLY_ACC=CAM_ASM_000518 /TAXON_ID=46462 /ORGANISM="Anophryoides haemophila, Strain AH6" /LENGTH=30 /DNA_ID= /DNA_START= /DNA_END= /DNA_ORIENTATION=
MTANDKNKNIENITSQKSVQYYEDANGNLQ